MKIFGLVYIFLLVISSVVSQEGGATLPPLGTVFPVETEGPTTLPPLGTVFPPSTKKPQEPYCCNKCPPVKVKIVTKVETHVFKVNIPYPVFKQLPISSLTKCPDGFRKVSKRKCVHYVKSTSSCPPGYFRVSDQSCLKIVILPPTHPSFKVKCPTGYVQYGELGCKIGKSHKKKFPALPTIVVPTLPPTKIELPKPKTPLKCPAGFIQKGQFHCVKVISCPKGYKKNKSGFCIREKVKCPNGFTRLGRKCIKSLTVCPKGYTFNQKEYACVKSKGCKKKIYKDKCAGVKCANVKCKDGFKSVKKPDDCCPTCEKCKCSEVFDPVCGENGVTYNNAGHADCIGVKVVKKGACPSKCPKAVHKCPYYYRPVCGVDGVTYNNRCSCEVAGVQVKSSGVCPKACPKK